MLNFRQSLKSSVAAVLIAVSAISVVAPTIASAAQDRDGRRGERSDNNRGGQGGANNRGDNNRGDDNRGGQRGGQRGDTNCGPPGGALPACDINPRTVNPRADNGNRGGGGYWGDNRADNNNRNDNRRADADRGPRNDGGRNNPPARNDRQDDRNGPRYDARFQWRGDRHWDRPQRVVVARPRPAYYRPYNVPRARYYNNIRVYRPYGLAYPGFGFYYRDTDAFRFLGLTALSLAVFSQLNKSQQRAHEAAFVEATSADIGEPIYWNDGGRSGRVTAVRDGTTTDGRQCREFQQEVTIGGDQTEAYGTACLQPDGSWEVVNDQ